MQTVSEQKDETFTMEFYFKYFIKPEYHILQLQPGHSDGLKPIKRRPKSIN